MHCFYSLEQFYRRLDHTWKVGGNPRVLLGYALYSIFAIGSIRPKVTRTLSDRTLPEDLTTLAGWTPEGNYRRTQLALTKVYDLIEQRYMSFMDVAGVGPFLPISVTREERKNFVFTKREDNGISTHLNLNVNQNSPEKEVAAADMAPHKSGNFNEKIIGVWPGSLNHLEYLMGPRLQDSKFTYRTTNGFTNVGKGISLLEKQKGRSP
ncbi:lipoxygenase [Penicillium chrysogenum]|uniref:Lipoxygenase n=1 Tax=Penicillium chrysogenum TaxID=5076 RepID=A0ABQ8W7A9_PENCH|nr:lipoxygenase [Penicillium chrysogenum]KAJ5252595.1 lipoxygenase [Penicillium chrysogenum]KAJ5259835.1 lipoxygenase [Penicillium chrysogenum]KAJ6142299.1 lipoxygenase [Penicillium chrysogenum]